MKKNLTDPLFVSPGISTLIEDNFFQNKEIEDANLFITASQIQELERIRLGHELHDDVNSTLAVAKLYVQMASEKSKEGKKAMKLALSAIMSAMDSIRNISSNMVVSQRKDFDLTNGTKNFLKKIATANIFKITCRFSKDFKNCGLTNEQQICLYRIVQEQMNNILKYSHAENVEIHLACKKSVCMMEIKDDGMGCDTSKCPNGIGLMNIFNRVEDLNGTTSVISSVGQGFLLRVTLPIN